MTEKSLASVINSCIARKLHERDALLKDSPGPYLTRCTCRKHFTGLRNVRTTGDIDITDDVPIKRLRSSVDLCSECCKPNMSHTVAFCTY